MQMTPATQIAAELTARIDADRRHHGGELPERTVIAWRGYLAGMLEWGVLDPPLYERLISALPPTPDDPAVEILRGRSGT
jgi:hypothetical protein